MSSNTAPYHDTVTSDITSTNPTSTSTSNNYTTGTDAISSEPAASSTMDSTMPSSNRSGSITYSSSASDPNATTTLPQSSTGMADGSERRTSLAALNPDSTHPARDVDAPVNPSTETEPLNAHHRPSIQGDDHQGLAGDETIRRASLAQNAPGKAGSIGEAALGAFGYGGSTVERPKEDQGIGEKIAEFLGA